MKRREIIKKALYKAPKLIILGSLIPVIVAGGSTLGNGNGQGGGWGAGGKPDNPGQGQS